MKTRWLVCALVAAGSLGFFAGIGFTEDPPPSEEEMMKQMMELAKPGPEHKLLEAMAGAWDSVMTSYMTEGEPQVTKGSATNTMVLDGRFLQQTFAGSWGGMPYNGMGLFGYDNFLKKFQSVWIDSFGTYMAVAEGKGSDDGKAISAIYTWDGPMGKIPGRMLYTITGKDSHKIESWTTQGGKEVKGMEILFTRKAASAPDGSR